MTTIEQLPERIDSNVEIVPPAKIEIKHKVNEGWYIIIDGVTVQHEVLYGNISNQETKYFKDAAEPMEYLIERHLVKTKAYRELEKAVKKVHNRNSKSKKN